MSSMPIVVSFLGFAEEFRENVIWVFFKKFRKLIFKCGITNWIKLVLMNPRAVWNVNWTLSSLSLSGLEWIFTQSLGILGRNYQCGLDDSISYQNLRFRELRKLHDVALFSFVTPPDVWQVKWTHGQEDEDQLWVLVVFEYSEWSTESCGVHLLPLLVPIQCRSASIPQGLCFLHYFPPFSSDCHSFVLDFFALILEIKCNDNCFVV